MRNDSRLENETEEQIQANAAAATVVGAFSLPGVSGVVDTDIEKINKSLTAIYNKV